MKRHFLWNKDILSTLIALVVLIALCLIVGIFIIPSLWNGYIEIMSIVGSTVSIVGLYITLAVQRKVEELKKKAFEISSKQNDIAVLRNILSELKNILDRNTKIKNHEISKYIKNIINVLKNVENLKPIDSDFFEKLNQIADNTQYAKEDLIYVYSTLDVLINNLQEDRNYLLYGVGYE